MPGDPKECREHAENCRDIAAAAISPMAKARFDACQNMDPVRQRP